MTAQIRPSFNISLRGLEGLHGSGHLCCIDERVVGGILTLATLERLGGWNGAFSSADLCLFGAASAVIGEAGVDHINGP